MELSVLGKDNKVEDKEIHLTDSAIRYIRAAMAKEEGIAPETGGFRIGIQGGGCSGMSYSIGFEKEPGARDQIFRFGDLRVFVDPKSLRYLQGITLDYEETVIRQGFTFNNPNATKSCGCGTSFSIG